MSHEHMLPYFQVFGVLREKQSVWRMCSSSDVQNDMIAPVRPLEHRGNSGVDLPGKLRNALSVKVANLSAATHNTVAATQQSNLRLTPLGTTTMSAHPPAMPCAKTIQGPMQHLMHRTQPQPRCQWQCHAVTAIR
jgi:hypothetical protein